MHKLANRTQTTASNWTSREAYLMATVCLLVGIAIGYLLRGPSTTQPQASTAGAASVTPPASMGDSQVTPAQLKHMADVQAQPLLQQLQSSPNDAALLAKLGNVYYDTQQYSEAVKYYDRSLQGNPQNVNVRTDMGTAYWYMGDPDTAITQFQKSLSYNPDHPDTLYNLGIVKLQGKNDPVGALAAWEKLAKVDPAFAARANLSDKIAQAKQQGGR
jgi:cytochrome c-type biogenesis protein CcmH/NrfG